MVSAARLASNRRSLAGAIGAGIINPGGIAPANAVTLRGQPITLRGQFPTLKKAS